MRHFLLLLGLPLLIITINTQANTHDKLSNKLCGAESVTYECLDFWTNYIPEAPETALDFLENAQDPTANAFAALIYYTNPKLEDKTAANKLMNQAIQYFVMDENNDYRNVAAFQPGQAYEYDNLTQLLTDLRLIIVGNKDINIPCWLFEQYPNEAYRAFNAYFGSSLDRYAMPNCDIKTISQLPELETFFALIGEMNHLSSNPACFGTSEFGKQRRHYMALLQASLSPKSYLNKKTNIQSEKSNLALQSLQLWASESLGNYHNYQKLIKEKKDAIPHLAKHYEKMHLSPKEAKLAAGLALNSYLNTAFDYSYSINYGFGDNYHTYDTVIKNPIYLSMTNNPSAPLPCIADNTCKEEDNLFMINIGLRYGIAAQHPLPIIKQWLELMEDWSNYLNLAMEQPELAKHLLQHPTVSIETNDEIGKTPLFLAIQARNLETVKTLVSAGADVTHKTSSSEKTKLVCHDLEAFERTPLMYAAWQGTGPIIEYLLEQGADKEARDSNEERAVHYLKKNKYLTPKEKQYWKKQL